MLVALLAIIIGALAGIIIPSSWYLLTVMIGRFQGVEIWRETFPLLVCLALPLLIASIIFVLFFAARTYRSADAFTYLISDLHFNEGRRKLRYSLVHGFSSFLLLVGGGIVGIEAFAIEFLTALGGWLGSKAKLSPSQIRTLTSCGIVASLSALWGQPLVGILFAIELLHGWGSVVSIVGPFSLSAFAAAAVGQAMTAQDGLLQYRVDTDGGLALAIRGELFATGGPNIILGLLVVATIAAIVAGFVIWINQKTDREMNSLFATRRATDFSLVATAIRLGLWAVTTGIVAFYFPDVLGSGIALTQQIVSQSFVWQVAIIGLGLRILLGVFTYTTIGSMGLIFPMLVLGAGLGAALAIPLSPMLGISSAACAVLGMGALFSAAFGAPISATALVYSSATGVVSENAFFLFAVLSTNFLSHYLCGLWQWDRLATMGLYRHGIRFRNGMCFNTLSSIKVSDAMLTWVTPISKDSSMADAYKMLMESRFLKLPVTDNENNLCGMISLGDFYGLEAWRKLEAGAQVQQLLGIAELLKPAPGNIFPEMSLENALSEMHDEELMAVTKNDSQTYLGFLVKSDVVNLYNKEVVKKAFRR
jgi:chloride channel protein, CIC family